MIGREDYTLVISFVLKGFPYKDQIEELFIVMVYFMYSQLVTLLTFSLISLFYRQRTYPRHDVSFSCWKCC